MSFTIHAVFDSGVFRPLEPVELAEGTQVEVCLPGTDRAAGAELSGQEFVRQQTAIDEMLEEIENLPVEEPDDGFSGRDHDRILYGAR